MTGSAATRIEGGIAKWLGDKGMMPAYAFTDTGEKKVPCLTVQAPQVAQPGWPDNYFECGLVIQLVTAAPQTTIAMHRDMEDAIAAILGDVVTVRDEVSEGVQVSGFRLDNSVTEYEENRTITSWTIACDFNLYDGADGS
jgi:hypothetical protein